MSNIDTSPAALRKLADDALCNTAFVPKSLLLAIAAEKEAQQPRPTDDELWDGALSDRDKYHDIADKLANAIAAYIGIDIGEHSNLNCPWLVALEALEQHHKEQPLEMVAQADVPLPGHPEPHTHRWTALELEAIKQHREAYAKAKVAAERERWIDAVTTELDNNGQAKAIVLAAQKGTP